MKKQLEKLRTRKNYTLSLNLANIIGAYTIGDGFRKIRTKQI